jgi:hypothetical protein
MTDEPTNSYSASTFCYAKHTPDLNPGDYGYCSGSCNRVEAHSSGDHVCNACGKSF